ncbi:MAG: toll/interleukin-1 receptor domain-containing protein [Pyrinomonadaceae bacterium]
MTKTDDIKTPIRVFFSFDSRDREIATELRKAMLRHPNVQLFTRDGLSAGEDWSSKLKNELYACDVFAVLLTENAIDSPWVLQELGAVWGLSKPIYAFYSDPWVSAKIPVPLGEQQLIPIWPFEESKTVASFLERYSEEATTVQNKS